MSVNTTDRRWITAPQPLTIMVGRPGDEDRWRIHGNVYMISHYNSTGQAQELILDDWVVTNERTT